VLLLAILCSVVVAYPHAAGVVRGLDEVRARFGGHGASVAGTLTEIVLLQMGESKEDFASIRARLATEMKASHAVLDDQGSTQHSTHISNCLSIGSTLRPLTICRCDSSAGSRSAAPQCAFHKKGASGFAH